MKKETFAKIYIAFSIICFVGSFWIEWLIFVFLGVLIIVGLIAGMINDYQKDKRLEYLEEEFAKRGRGE